VSNFITGNGDSAGSGDVKAAEEIKHRGFAGTAGAHESNEVALVDIQIKALEDLNLLATALVGFVETADLD
jgi:hypothetical protein